jgi:glycosyltransferase involved in cell wall biosynthesis
MTGLISVVIVSYRDDPFLPGAIESVLAQDDPAIELLVVDNEPSGAVAEIVMRYSGEPVRRITSEGTTVGAGRNAGARAARGSLLAFLDADDLWPLERLAAARSALADGQGLDGVFGRACTFSDRGVTPIADPAHAARIAGPPQEARMITAAVFRRPGYDRVGPFDAETVLGSELDWVARAEDARLRLGWIDEVVLLRRSHAGNTTRARPEEYGGYARTMKRIIDRRRGRP